MNVSLGGLLHPGSSASPRGGDGAGPEEMNTFIRTCLVEFLGIPLESGQTHDSAHTLRKRRSRAL